jgi:hypothetical protein
MHCLIIFGGRLILPYICKTTNHLPCFKKGNISGEHDHLVHIYKLHMNYQGSGKILKKIHTYSFHPILIIGIFAIRKPTLHSQFDRHANKYK